MTRWMLLLLFGIYMLVVLGASRDQFRMDEGTYVRYATNLAHGFYSPRSPQMVSLQEGPGYPLLLAPFAKLGLPWLAAKILNALLLLAGMLLFRKTLRMYVSQRTADWGALLMGLYPPFLRHIHLLMTETLAVFLVCAFAYLLCRAYGSHEPRRLVLLGAAAVLAWLSLTKVIFGYVVLGMLVLCLTALLLRRPAFKRAALVFALALGFCTPYLFYTWSLTGHVFYWDDQGGEVLYWMSTPYEGELGDWQDWSIVPAESRVRRNHEVFVDSLRGLGALQRNDALMRQAVRNIKTYPTKYVRNWVANVGRLIFSMPFTDTPQKLSTLFYALPNTILLVSFGLSLLALAVARPRVPGEIAALLMMATMAFGGSTLVSATTRFLVPLVPLFTLWIVFVLSRSFQVRIIARHDLDSEATQGSIAVCE